MTLLPCGVAAQKKLGNSVPLASSTTMVTARCHRMSSPPTTALLSTRCQGSKTPSRANSCASLVRRDTQDATAKIRRARNASTALHATEGDSIEIAGDDDSSPAKKLSSPSDLVEVATFGAPHGVRGEVRIFPVTDEPEERLLEGAEAGARFWVAPQVESRGGGGKSGGRGGDILIGRGSSSSPAAVAPKPRLVRIEAARPAPISRSSKKGSPNSPGSTSWLLKLRGIDSPEAAAALANNSLWVSAAERPALPEAGDDFYAQELIGMEARLGSEASEKLVGVVVDVCEGGGTDLLRLELSDNEAEEEEGEEEEVEVEAEVEEAAILATSRRQGQQRKAAAASLPPSRRTVLLPFTQAFVPHVDRVSRRMIICPPDGLLDLAISPPKAQLKQEQEEAAAAARAAASGGEGAGVEGEKKSRPRRPRGRKARDRAGGGTAAPPSA